MITRTQPNERGEIVFTKDDKEITLNLNDFDSGQAVIKRARELLGGGPVA